MLDIFKNLLGKKTPEGIINLSDMHFISCITAGKVSTFTWEILKKEVSIFNIKDEAMASMYGKTAYDLKDYGFIELFDPHTEKTYYKAKIIHKGGIISGLEPTEEFLEQEANVVIDRK